MIPDADIDYQYLSDFKVSQKKKKKVLYII